MYFGNFCRTYLISSPIVPYYYTQLIGDAKTPPTLLAAATFDGIAVIGAVTTTILRALSLTFDETDANPYIPGGNGDQYWVNQNNL